MGGTDLVDGLLQGGKELVESFVGQAEPREQRCELRQCRRRRHGGRGGGYRFQRRRWSDGPGDR